MGAGLIAGFSTLTELEKTPNFLRGLGMGLAPAAAVTQAAASAAAFQSAQNSADRFAASLGVLAGVSGAIAGVLPPSPFKVALGALSLTATAAQALVQAREPLEQAMLDALDEGTQAFNSFFYGRPGTCDIEELKRKLASASEYPSPIVLDLDGDGVETLALGSGVYFDHADDGFAERTGWVGSDDGLLVRDLDGNETIDSGRELFGSETRLPSGTKAANGFEALQALDTNTDDVIDASDAAFAELRVWQDTNGNGRTDAGELLTLAETGVQSINVSYANSNHIDAQGNAHRQLSSYTTLDGQARAASDVWFQTNLTQSLPTGWLAVPEDIAALPDSQGYGLVSDLHQAMARDASGQLKTLVAAFTEASVREDRLALLRQIVFRWTGVQDVDPTSRTNEAWGNAIGDARRLEALEACMGEEWSQHSWGPNPGRDAARTLNEAYGQLEAFVYGQLMAQSHLKGLFQQVTYRWDEEIEEVVGDLTSVAHTLTLRVQTERDAGLDALGDFLFALRGMGLLDNLDVDSFTAQLGTLGDDVAQTIDAALQGWSGTNNPSEADDVLRGSDFNDAIEGRGGNDRLYGRGGDDLLTGGEGNDFLDGGAGNDEMRGGAGSDTYFFGRGHGHETITDGSWYASETDRIELQASLSADDVRLQRIHTGSSWTLQDDLRLTIRETGETITVKDHFNPSQRLGLVWFVPADTAIEEVFFADGTVWDAEAIRSQVLLGGTEDEELLGYRGRDDVIDGGAGNDLLRGASGSDTYRYGRGDGDDTVADDTWTPGETDRIELKAGLSAANVRLQRVRNSNALPATDDLVLTIRDTGETLTVKNHFNESRRHAVEEIVFADGTVWAAEDIRARTLLGGPEDDVLQGFHDREDVIDGGAGNDLLAGGRGSDTYHHQLGDGLDVIQEHHDIYSTDVLRLGDGVSPDDVQLRWNLRRELQVLMPDGGVVTVEGQASSAVTGSGNGIEFIRFADGTSWNQDEMYARTAPTTEGDDHLVLGIQDDVVDGGQGDDHFTNLEGHDTFLFGLGDGHDVIEETFGTLRFKQDIAQDDVRFTADGVDLVVTLTASAESVRLENWTTAWIRIGRFEFNDGTVLNTSEVEALLDAGEDVQLLFGSSNDDTLTATGPRAVLHGEEGNDTLTGGDGDDALYGGDGDDVLEGGAGRDTLHGDAGHNTYVMRRGMGLDTVRVESLATAQDVVVLPEGVRPQDITVGLSLTGPIDAVQDEDSVFDRLVIGIGENDALVIEGFDPVTAERLDVMQQAMQTFRFADGTALTLTELLALSSPGRLGDHYLGRQSAVDIQGSAGEDDIIEWYGQAPTRRVSAGDNNDRVNVGRNDHLVSGGWGNDDITTMGGADVVAGDAGDDFIRTGSQNDVVLFNRGDGHDRVHFGKGADTLSFGASIEPGDLSVALSPEGDWLILVDGGAGGSVQARPIDLDDPTNTDSLRLQFITATGEARVYDFTAWVHQNQNALHATSATSALAFDGTGVDISNRTPMAGSLAAVAHAQTGHLFGTATLVRASPSELDDWIHGTDDADAIHAGAGNDQVMGHGGNDVLLGGSGNDVLSGGEGDDVLEGGAGDDVLSGDAGSDVLWGGGGTDVLKGGMGGDTYRFELGDGNVTIEDGHELMEGFGSSGFDDEEEEGDRIDSAPNVLAFGAGISAHDLVYTEVGNDLVITLRHSPQDRLVLKGFDPGRATFTRSVDVFRFQDGTEIVELDTTQVGVTEYGSDAGDWLFGTPVSDRLIGGGGDDRLFGLGGADRLAGGLGSDSYHVMASTTPGEPTQTVIAETWRVQDINVLVIEGEVHGNDLSLALEGNDLVVRIGPNGDSVRFAGFDPRAPGMPAPVEHIELADSGALIHFADLLAKGVYDPNAPLPDLRVNVGDGAVDVDAGGVANTSGTLVFGDGIDEAEIQGNLQFEADDNGDHWLVIHYGAAGDVLRLSGFNPADVLGGDQTIDRFRFADGTTLGYAALVSEGILVEGGEQTNDLTGTNLADRLHGAAGSEVLRGGEGDNEFHGGRGNDTLIGGDQVDGYYFQRGDGSDTIIDGPSHNFISFGPGISRSDLEFGWEADTLVLRYGDGDEIRIANFATIASSGTPPLTAIRFDDGDMASIPSLISSTQTVQLSQGELPVATEDAVYRHVIALQDFNQDGLFSQTRLLTLRQSDGSALPVWLTYDAERGTLLGLPSNEDVGQLDLVVEAWGDYGRLATQPLRLSVLNTNDAPEASADIAAQQAIRGAAFHFTVPEDAFRDVDAGDVLTLSATRSDGSALPAWLAFDPSTRIFTGTPGNDHVGLTIRLTATDLAGASVSHAFALNVSGGSENQAPITEPDAASVTADATAPLTGNVLHNDTDPDGDALSLLTTGAQQGILGVLTWHTDGAYSYALDGVSPALRALAAGQTATEHFAYTSTDGQAQAQGELVITVNGVNDAPVVQRALGNMLVIKKEAATWQLPADAFVDPDQGDTLSYSAALANGGSLPSWMAFDAATRTFLATPPANAKGNLAVQVTATDAHGASVSQVFEITVGNWGDKPKGNQGVGNGEDPPPLGHDHNFNDGPGTSPGNPGAKGGHKNQQTAALPTSAQAGAIAPVDWSTWGAIPDTAATGTTSSAEAVSIEQHWQQLFATLQQLDAERRAGDWLNNPTWGADLGLAGLSSSGLQAGASGASAVGLSVGAGTHLVSFHGLKEGVASLAA